MNITVNKTLIWISVILFLIIAALITGFWWYDHSKSKKESIKWQTLYYACKNAPADTTIRKDSIVYRDTTIYKPYPVKVIQIDSILVPYKESYYDSVWKKDGWRIRYSLKTIGSLDYIQFTDLVAPKEIITITKKIDTCINKPAPKRPIFLWGAYTGMSAWSFSEFPGVVVGGHTLIKEQLYVGVGGGYYKGFMGEVRIGIFFSRKNKFASTLNN